MTIYDIAKEAGVSASTVSRVINGKPGISENTRKKIQTLLKKYSFTPDAAARGLVTQSSGIVGILIEDIMVAHHAASAAVIEREMMKQGYCCITMNIGSTTEKRTEYIRILGERRVQGVFMIGSAFMTEEIRDLVMFHIPGIPVVMVNGFLDLPNVSGVVTDEKEGIRNCVSMLSKAGRKHIAFINDNPTPSNLQKEKGYLKGMEEVPGGRPGVFRADSPTIEAGYRAAKELLTRHPETDAIICSVDLVAAGGLRCAEDMDREVPLDLALTGVDNSLFSEICRPKITSLNNKILEASEIASDLMKKGLDGEMQHVKITLFAELVEKEST